MTTRNTSAAQASSPHYRISGAEGAPWLVFSNSLVTDLTVWDGQMAPLEDCYRILRYDQRGHGGSALPTPAVTFRDLAGDVITLLDRLGIERCTFVGLSMGVPTGLALWRDWPERIERLVLINGLVRTAEGGGAAWRERIAHAREVGMETLAESFVTRWFTPDLHASEAATQVRAGIAATSLEGFIACAEALADFDLSAVAPTIRVPTLLMAGERDGRMPETMAATASSIPGSRLFVVPGSGHIANVERPQAFNRALADFLLETAPSANWNETQS